MNEQKSLLWQQSIPGGCHWSGILRRGTTLRLTDMEGGANAAVLFFNQEEKLERYNMADTLKAQHTFRLTKGQACYSDMGRIFCCITADTAGWNDTVCGLIDARLIRQKYGIARYQEHRNQMFRSGLDGMLIELGVSSMTFWLRRCMEQSRSPSASTWPLPSPKICTSI